MTNPAGAPFQSLTFQREERPEAVVLLPSGEVDLLTAPVLVSSLAAILEGGRNVIVRLGELTYIDSTGLKALLDAHRLSRERGQHLVLAEPTSMVRRIMDITGIEKAIPIYASVQEAVQSLRTPPEVDREA